MNIDGSKFAGLVLVGLGIVGLLITMPFIAFLIGAVLFFKDDIKLQVNKWLDTSNK